MSDTDTLDTFRTQTRAWLEQNCPSEMRRPMSSEDDVCWGGRNAKFTSEAQRIWLQHWTKPRCWRRRCAP